MCQSKAKGGFRCATHVQDAIADHKNKYSRMVQQECTANGIIINPQCFELTPAEKNLVTSQIFLDPSVQKMRKEIVEANHQVRVLQASLSDALAVRNVNKLALIIREHNPELQAIKYDNEARKRRFNEYIANPNLNEDELEKALKQNKNQLALLNKRKEKLNLLSKTEAVASFETYKESGDITKALASVSCLNTARSNVTTLQDKAVATSQRVRTRLTDRIVAEKLVTDPGFKAAESSDAFRNSAKFKEWEAREKELAESYRMTAGYHKKVLAKISSYKKLGMDTTEMELAYKALHIRKAKFTYKSITEAYGVLSPEARVAKEAYEQAQQKELSF